jgi:hypothetical protein
VVASDIADDAITPAKISIMQSTATSNLGLGTGAVDAITTGDYNVGLGDSALTANTEGSYNVGSGSFSLYSNTTGVGNVASGYYSLHLNSTGNYNTANGYYAGYANTTGAYNTSIGSQALYANTTGAANVAIGNEALKANTTGSNNAAVGQVPLYSCTTGAGNTAMGHAALYSLTTGIKNLALGFDAGRSASPSGNITTESNRICLGANAITNAYVKVAWTVTSDQRDKADITNFTHGLDYVNELRPVNFVWDDRSNYEDGVSDGSKKKSDVQLGFLAQEVQAVETGLGIDNNAIIDTEQLDLLKMTESKLIPVLVNAIQELSSKNDALEARLIALENA